MLSAGFTGLMLSNSNNVLINKSDSDALAIVVHPNQSPTSNAVELNHIVDITQPKQNESTSMYSIQWRNADSGNMCCDRFNIVFHLVFFIVDCSFGVFTFVENPSCLKPFVPIVLCYTIMHAIIPLIIFIANINKIVPGVCTYVVCVIMFVPITIAAEVFLRNLDESCNSILHEQYPSIYKMLDVEIYASYFCFASPIVCVIFGLVCFAVLSVLACICTWLSRGYNTLIERIQK